MNKASNDKAVFQVLQELDESFGLALGFVVVFHLWKRYSGDVFAVAWSPVVLDMTSCTKDKYHQHWRGEHAHYLGKYTRRDSQAERGNDGCEDLSSVSEKQH